MFGCTEFTLNLKPCIKSIHEYSRGNMWCIRFGGLSAFALCVLALDCVHKSIDKAGAGNVTVKAKVPAIFTFGDSIMDPGNNNYIPTLGKANHLPYGQDFVDKESTGRFSNGKLSSDFIAAMLGVKDTVPPFLEPDLNTQDLLTGVSFASAGTGFDNLTANAVSVVPMWKQVELFKAYKARLEDAAGERKSSNIIEQALFLVVAGTNDFIDNYLLLPIRRNQFSVAQYHDFVLHISTNFIQEVYKLGVRKLAFAGLPPLGCLPLQKTLHGLSKLRKGSICIEEFNQIAVSYNTKLKATLQRLEAQFPGIKLAHIDIYDSLLDIIKYPTKYGFETSDRGCCGSGLIEFGPTCNVNSTVCTDASKFVFWDAAHPTQKAYEILAKLIGEKYISNLL